MNKAKFLLAVTLSFAAIGGVLASKVKDTVLYIQDGSTYRTIVTNVVCPGFGPGCTIILNKDELYQLYSFTAGFYLPIKP